MEVGTTMDLTRAVWRTSTRSQANGECVEVADLGHTVAVRDSKDRHGPVLTFTPAQWRTFVDAAKADQLTT